jgi:lipopolysaccharide/colanic/teichoic acid biosynthesis glycosyltransferase
MMKVASPVAEAPAIRYPTMWVGPRLRREDRAFLLVAAGRLPASTDRLTRALSIVGQAQLPIDHQGLLNRLVASQAGVLLVDAALDAVDLALLQCCAEARIDVLVVADPIYGLLSPRRIVRLGGVAWLRLRPFGRLPLHVAITKRLLDLVVVLLVSPLVASLALTVAVAVALSSKGGVLYRQARVGEGGKRFKMLKFRTMRVGAEDETGPVFSSDSDSRTTGVGRMLRRSHLDELPQLWNVLAGHMSLVGPRPERPEFVGEFLSIPDYECRHLLRPGLTGVAQLTSGYHAGPAQKLRWDLLYVSACSVQLDTFLLLSTARDLLRGFPNG